MDVQKAVTDYIEQAGIKQVHIAQNCDFSKQKMNAIMNHKQNISLDDYGRICVALGVPFDFFYNKAKEAGA